MVGTQNAHMKSQQTTTNEEYKNLQCLYVSFLYKFLDSPSLSTCDYNNTKIH